MAYKYEQIFKEYDGIDNLDSDSLNPKWVKKVKKFLELIKQNEELDDKDENRLSEDEISQMDTNLYSEFDQYHDINEIEEDNSEEKEKLSKMEKELAQIKRDNQLKDIANKVKKADLNTLKELRQANEKDKEVCAIIDPVLNPLLEEEKIEKEKKENAEKYRKEIIANKQKLISIYESHESLSYDDLRGIGLEPNGQPLEYYGMIFLKQFMFLSYVIKNKKEQAELCEKGFAYKEEEPSSPESE